MITGTLFYVLFLWPVSVSIRVKVGIDGCNMTPCSSFLTCSRLSLFNGSGVRLLANCYLDLIVNMVILPMLDLFNFS